MSQSYTKLKPILVTDPVTDANDVSAYAVLQGGNKVSYKQFTSTSIANSSIQFSCPPPSNNVIVNRYIRFTAAIRLTFTGTIFTTNNAFQPPTSLLNAGLDAPRFLPLSSMIESLQININNTSVSVALSDIIHPLTRYNICPELRRKEYSTTAAYPDCSFNYTDLVGTARNPLGNYGNTSDGDEFPRGGAIFTIVPGTNVAVVPTVAGTAASAVVDMYITEPLFLSPLFWGNVHDNVQGFYNVTSMDFNISFLAQAAFRAWSHANLVATSGAIQVTSIINTGTVQFNNFNAPAFSYSQNYPTLLFEYISPNLLTKEKLGPNIPITYPFFDIQRYPTDIGALTFAQGSAQFNSNNIQLSTIPRHLYLFARPTNQTLQTRCDITDCYLAITNVQVQWANQSVLLSSASQTQLYMINLKNNSSQDFVSWSGQGVYNGAFPPNALSAKYGGVGSVLCLDFGRTIQLEPGETPGLSGQFQLQITCNFQNMNSSGAWDAIPMTFYIVVVSEGTFTIPSSGYAQQQLGVITPTDVLDAQAGPSVSFNQVERLNGGDFLSSLGNFASKVNDFLKQSKAVSTISGFIPHPVAQLVSKGAEAVGYGESGGMAIQGGRSVHKSQLRLM